MHSILVVEDEKHLADGLKFNLGIEGYEVTVAPDAETAAKLIDGGARFDALVLDVMLPGMNGFDLARKLRLRGLYIPILMLTARSRPDDIVKGFESGADDYLPKPFELSVFLARVRSLLRRREWLRDESLKPASSPVDDDLHVADAGTKTPRVDVGNRQIDFETLEITGGDAPVSLTVMEADLLRYLIEHSGKVVSRKSLLADLWGLHEDTDTRAIDNFIVRLRRYIEPEPAKPRFLLTVRGVGYRFVLPSP